MADIISAQVYTLLDVGGNPRVEGWFIWEFQENYVTGGVAANLSEYFRRVEQMLVSPVSGATYFQPRVHDTSIPGDPRSGLIQLWGVASGAGVSIASGIQGFVSGQLLSGNISGQVYFALFSGRLAAQTTFAEIADATAVSGTRVRIFALGA